MLLNCTRGHAWLADVGKLLGGAGSREAYLRGILEARSRHGYGYEAEEQEKAEEPGEGEGEGAGAADAGAEGEEDELDGDDLEGLAEPLLRMRYLDRHFRLASKVVRCGRGGA